MPAPLEVQREVARHHRPHVPLALRHVGQPGPHVQATQDRSRCLHARDDGAHSTAQLIQYLRLAYGNAVFGTENFRLIFLQLGRHVALGARERLAALVVGRNALAIGMRDFDVIAKDLVEADLERSDAGALPLARLEPGDVLLAAVAYRLQVVEARVIAGFDRVAIIELRGRPLYQRACEFVADVGDQVELVCGRLEQRRALPALQSAQGARRVRQPQDRVAQRSHFARRRPTESGPTGEAFEITHAVEGFSQPRPTTAVANQNL